MTAKTTERKNNGNITPDQADYRGHVLFNRTSGQQKGNAWRRHFDSGRSRSQQGYRHETNRADEG